MSDDEGECSKKKKETSLTAEVQRVNIKLPPFWPNSPAAWFVQTEAQFQIGRITSDMSKYNYVVASLPQDVAESILDILVSPPENNHYSQLKTTLINRHSLSIERRVKKLISDEEMGDKRPSDFYRTLKQLAGTSGTVSDELIRNIWTSRLPHLISIALIPQKDLTIDNVLPVADQVWEALQTSHVSSIGESSNRNPVRTSIPNPSGNDKYNNLENQISELRAMIAQMNVHNERSRSRDRSQNWRSRSNSRRRFNPKGNLCWFHYKFGDKARRCNAPCSRSSQSHSNSGAIPHPQGN